jgi:hypothetical protein
MNQERNNQEGIDLSGMLKDSEVNFQNKQGEPAQFFRPGTPKIIQWVIKYSGGLIRNERQAAYILIGFVALAIIITIIIVVSSGSNQPTPGPVPVDQLVP